MNYERVSKGLSAAEAAKYAIGTGLVNDFVNSLRGKNLLPKKFVQSEVSTTPVLPEGAIRLPDLTIGGNDKQQLIKLADSTPGVRLNDWARDLIGRPGFTTLEEQRTISLVKVSPRALGITGNQTLSDILERAKTFNLEKVPSEAAVYQRIVDRDQPLGDVYWMAMKPITDSRGLLRVFGLVRYGDGSWLHGYFAVPDGRWDPGLEFVFSVRPPAGEASK